METFLFSVEGMSCSHCEAAVKRAVGAIKGVTAVAVSLSDKRVEVTADSSVSREVIARAIDDEGYTVKA